MLDFTCSYVLAATIALHEQDVMSSKTQVDSFKMDCYAFASLSNVRSNLPSCSWAESCHDTLWPTHFPDRPQCKRLGPYSRDHTEHMQLHRD